MAKGDRRRWRLAYHFCGIGDVLSAMFLVSAAAAVLAVTGARAASPSPGRNVYPLRVVEVKTPKLDWSCKTASISVGGTYPQVLHDGVPLSTVNAALRAAALADQRFVVSGACPQSGRYGRPTPAIYRPEPDLTLRISASSVVVSALMLAVSTPPAANFSYDWTAATVRVATAARVGIGDLFHSPSEGLRTIAAAVRVRLSASHACVRRSPNPSGFAPTSSNYRYFALTTKGLAIGFTAGAIAPRSCGWFLVTVPYTVLRPHLNSLGRTLIAGVRAPLR